MYKSDNPIYRDLNDTEEEEFRKWARDNFKPGTDHIESFWHPIVREECQLMLQEYHEKTKG